MHQHYKLTTICLIITAIQISITPHITQAEWSSLSTEERLIRLEKVIQNQTTTIERLRNELQEIRDQLERQTHTIESITKRSFKPDNTRTIADTETLDSMPLVPAADKPIATDTTSNTQEELSTYTQAFEQLKAGQYEEAIQGFRSQLATYPNGQYAGNAQYWLGETYYVTRNFDSALQTFNQLLEQYPKSNKIAGAMLKLGFIHQERKQTEQATNFLKQVITNFPNSNEAKLAQQRLDLIAP